MDSIHKHLTYIKCQKLLINILFILLFLLNLNCATMIFSGIGKVIGGTVDTVSRKKIPPSCISSEMATRIRENELPVKSFQYKAVGSTVGFVIDLAAGIAYAFSEPITGLKVIGSVIYIWFSGMTGAAMNMDSPPRIDHYNNSWFSKNSLPCSNTEDFFYTIQFSEIDLNNDTSLEDKKKICKQEENKLLEKAYLSFAERNFDKLQKSLLIDLKKKLPKPEIFPHEEHLINYKSYDGFMINCKYQIVFYYKGGKEQLKKDFSNYD
ncbi:MAG: hypothetical protein SFU98_12960 [Leptospiraceae bacterium]|nr:hypothetical protein [Leptospiraceae bacterium]